MPRTHAKKHVSVIDQNDSIMRLIYLQSSHLCLLMIKSFVYIRIVTNKVVNVRHVIMVTSRAAKKCIGGFFKFGVTPGGGLMAGD